MLSSNNSNSSNSTSPNNKIHEDEDDLKLIFTSVSENDKQTESYSTSSNLDSGYIPTAVSSYSSSESSESSCYTGGSSEFISASTSSSCEFISTKPKKTNQQSATSNQTNKNKNKKLSPTNNETNTESSNVNKSVGLDNSSSGPLSPIPLSNDDNTSLGSSEMSLTSCDSSIDDDELTSFMMHWENTNDSSRAVEKKPQAKTAKSPKSSPAPDADWNNTASFLNSISTELLNSNENDDDDDEDDVRIVKKEQKSNNEHVKQKKSSKSSKKENLLPSSVLATTSTTGEQNNLTKSQSSNGNNPNTALAVPVASVSSSSISFNNNNSKFSSEFSIPPRLEYLLDLPICAYETQVANSWNPDDRSLNIFVKEADPLTLHRHPVAQSTDCIRTKVAYSKGIHLWELSWNSRQRGTHAIIGVSTEKTPLHCVGYQSLIGSSAESWGWDLGRNRACHNTKASSQPPPVYPKMLKPDETFVVPDNFMMCLDMDEGTLSFLAEGQFLGVAFRGLKGKKLFPIVSAVWGHCEITMKYINGLDPNPLPLVDLARRCIRQKVGKTRLNEINKLNLPNSIKNFLLYKQ